MNESDKEQRRDVSGWKNSTYAKEFRTIIRWIEKQGKKDPDNDWYEEELYRLKLAILEEDYDQARLIADKMEQYMDMFF